ncbi:MAG TPA: xanthine dehydrogenase family protein subunit M [Acidimicrobiales bacterium]|nr:xanthine dehydrogenase family protein subunit M [Acidimicrobiales bacterium]
MKPAPFVYVAPASLDEAVAALAEHGEDAKVLAGGQSLIPLLSLRLARPTALIDLNGVAELSSISANGAVTIGAMTRHRAVERSSEVARLVPLLSAAVPYIGHAAIRTRGTIGGSLAHADPAAELPAVALALDATFEVRSTRGSRVIAADDFFEGYFTTALTPDEVLTSVTFPKAAPGTGVSVQEMARRHGDFAMVAAVATVAPGDVRIAMINVADRPVRAREAEAAMQAGVSIDEAAALAVRDLDPSADLHATAAYRRSVAEVLVRRALTEASDRAKDAS